MKTNHFLPALSLLALISSVGLSFAPEVTRAAPDDELQSWINKNAVAVRSVDAADEEFADLEFLTDAIGSAQVVLIGEASHVAGNSFTAKTRLVKFLHQRMGFDVLVWETGMYGVRLAQAGMRGSDDALTAAQRGISWSSNKDLGALFEYAKASQPTTRPLEMSGYDAPFSAPAFKQFSSDLRSFAAALHESSARKQSQDAVESAIAAYDRICCKKDVPAGQKELDALQRSSGALLAAIGKHRKWFEQAHGARQTSFMERAVESLRSDGMGQFFLAQPATGVAEKESNFSQFWRYRDTQGGRNLRWLIEHEYPGRKLIVWAHNAHVANVYFGPAFRGAHLQSRPDSMRPAGAYVSEWLGDKAYTIGLTNYEGTESSLANGEVKSVPPTPPGSLEERLHALGKPYLYLNLRALDSNPAHPLRKTQSLRIIVPSHVISGGSGSYVLPDITRVFDGIFYIDQLTPAARTPR